MDIEALSFYETELLEPPAFPSRSRLYPLAPIGVGTPEVESLTSYLSRLAYAHGVTVAKLAAAELAPVVNKPNQTTRNKFAYRTRNLNGTGDWTELTIAALEKLTLREEIRFLTLFPWRNVLSRVKLLRHHLAWCSACYHEWWEADQTLYHPLLWTLEVVQLCPRHQQALWHHCPHAHCHRRLPLLNSRVKPGFCPACKRWLGEGAAPPAQPGWPESQWKRQRLLTTQVAELLSTAPRLPVCSEQHTLVQNIRACLGDDQSIRELACEVGMSPSSLTQWLQGSHLPRLEPLLKLCLHRGWRLVDFFTPQPDHQDRLEWAMSAQTENRSSRKVEPTQLARQLEAILADGQQPPTSVTQVARQLGLTPRSLLYHCPAQYRQLIERHEQYRRTQRQLRNETLERDLKAVLESDETPPPSFAEVARRLQLNRSLIRQNFPDLCRLISRRRQTFDKARQVRVEAGLQAILAADEEPRPSIGVVAARLDENINYLYRKFPGLCRAVTSRYRNDQQTRAKQKSRKPARGQPVPSKGRHELQRPFAAIIAAGEKPPPSLAEVSRQLECSISVLRKGHPDLCRELGQQRQAYRQEQTALLEARVREILAANETPPPSVPAVAKRLGVGLGLLKRRLPALYAEVVRRHQAHREAERHRRRAFLEQLVADNPIPPPSLSQVAETLGCDGSVIQRQFPEVSGVIVARYRAYRKQEHDLAKAALEAALSSELSSPLLPFQVAQELGYPNSVYLMTYFPDLCHQLVERYEVYKRQMTRAKLETFLAKAPTDPPLALETISQQLGYNCATLKNHCPELCQEITNQYHHYWNEKKLTVKRALEAVASGERTPPPSLRAIAGEFGYSPDTLRRCFPDLTAAVVERHRTHLKERGQQRCQRLDEEVKRLTRELYQQDIDPTLRQVSLHLPKSKAIIAPHVRQAWCEARRELGLST